MTKSDRIRQGAFTMVFGLFVFYTLRYIDFNPYPKWLTEHQMQQWKGAGLDESTLIDGDLVLRHSKGFVADAILTFQTQDPQYSHSGIVKKIDGKTFIYHATGGEENVSQKMKCEPIEIYCHPAATYKFGVYRWDLTPAQRESFVGILDGYYKAGLEFDLDFDMTTNDKMYCSEMIYKALIKATDDKDYIALSNVLDKPYVAIDNLYLNPHCQNTFKYEYK
jgi:Permuted papain-like amidase enzyme, YaeF/YiiX, C92 family